MVKISDIFMGSKIFLAREFLKYVGIDVIKLCNPDDICPNILG